MSIEVNAFQRLAARVSRGDPGAGHELRQELEPHMARIVRRALRTSNPASPVARRIHAVASALASNHSTPSASGREGLVRQVAHSLCNSLLGRLQPSTGTAPALRDTVRI